MCGHRLYFLLDSHFSGPAIPCCDLCVLKKFADTLDSLTADESHALVLYDQIMTHRGPANQTPEKKGDCLGNEIDVDAQQLPTCSSTGDGPHCGEHLEAC